MTTTDYSHAPQFDTGPLSWVMSEIRDALGRSNTALTEAAERSAEAQLSSIKHAKAYLHQAHGALQMVDVDGAGVMTEAAERALDRFKDGIIECTPDRVQIIGAAYQAIIEYLEELLSGAPQQPARLFPYYRALKQLLGADRIHPADLFFADLSAPPALRPHTPSGTPPDYTVLRARFEKALLPFLKNGDAANAKPLTDAVAKVADAQDQPLTRTFWLAMQGFAELVSEGHLVSDVYVKQLFGLINLQMRRLSQGQGTLPEMMLRDALFFIAAAANPPESARALRRAYHLDGLVPADYDARRYGRIDAEALKAAKEALAKAKQLWDRLSTEVSPALESEFESLLSTLAGASEKLDAPALTRLLNEVLRAARDSVKSARGPFFSLEMATALLFVENNLDKIRQLPDSFDEHAEVVGARLLALSAGETPADAPQWQGDLSRKIQQEQTVGVLAAEMKHGLRQVEKVLDDYYADNSKRATLAQIDPVLHQLQGAVAILDQDDAMRAALHVKDAVRTLATSEGDAALEAASLQNIAQNIGALGFFVDMLASNPEAARERFAFSREEGMLRAVPFEKATQGESQFDQEPEAIVAEAPVQPVVEVVQPVPVAAPAEPAGEEDIEAELLEIFISEAQEVLALVAATVPSAEREPSNMETLTVLRRSFHTLKGSGRMVGLNNFGEGAAAIERAMNLWLSEARPASPDLLALLRHATTDMTAWVDQLAATGASQRNSAALVAAADRVAAGAAFTMDAVPAPQAQAEPVAATLADTVAQPAEAAEPVPEVVEMVALPAPDEPERDALSLDEEAIPELSLLEEAPAPVLEEVIEATVPADELALEEDEELADFEATLAEPVEPPVDDLSDAALHGEEIDASLPLADEIDAVLDEEHLDYGMQEAPVANEAEGLRDSYAPAGNVIEFPGLTRPVPALDDNTKRIGELEIPLPLYNIYLAETDELVRALTQDFSEWRHEPNRPVTPEAQKAAHTLAGTSATVGFDALREIAHCLEMVLKTRAPVFDDSQRALLDETIDTSRQMLQRFALGDLAPAQPELVARLNHLCDQLAAQEAAAVYAGADADLAEKLDGLFAETLTSIVETPEAAADAEPDLASEVEPVIEAVDLADATLDDPFDAPEPIEAVAVAVEDEPEEALEDAPEAELVPELISEAEPEAVAVLEVAPEPEPEPAPETEPEPEPVAATPVVIQSEAESAREKAAVDALLHEPEAEAAPSAVIETPFSDELDADLLPVFLEEGTDLLPEIGNNLRKWQQNPTDATTAKALLRTLHTVKGSARMAGAMRLGQHTHDIETQIENMVHAGTTTPAAFDELLANYDHALLLFEQLQQPADAAATPAAPAAGTATGAPQMLFPAQTANLDDANAAQAKSPLVRVRADILDRLVNQAGEVSITRSKLETQIATLKASLGDVAENLQRLRRQLREVEMQAESQISSRMSVSNEREFDPLEFDRFTRLQELTRGMAESVNDVASFHEALTRTVEDATSDLTQQSRLTRDLQRDLMRVRMVPFASLSERLFRVARQTAKELDKRVNLDIRGGSVEIDRSVLEQMSAPFEHLLRNAIVHGIESRQKRTDTGKMETGELLIQVSQQGNEVVIQFNDDGAGLDLNRIRAKARENGLIAAGVDVSDAEAADLIFEPGFSTADALTELAGRGVGMDVVRSQAQALGGRVAIWSDLGKGARFTIHLPLTLAVTQVVLTTSGNKTFALPSILVEQVLQIKEAAVNAAHAAGSIQFQGETVALHYLPTLLGDMEARPLSQRSCPILVLKSGNDRLAVQVDDVQGNREVVIKNIGPQLSRMIGISGATVLGSGDIVLILNPVALSHHLDHHPDLKPRAAVATAAAATPEAKAHDFVIMVVDDSLTVRKVTQRLLEREGYQVVLAKDGVDALEHLQETIPHLMLVDIEMPRMDGFDLTRNIRGNDSTKDIPIIMITSRTADKHRNYAIDLGVNAYFGKPFQEDMLVAAIAGLLNREMPVAS